MLYLRLDLLTGASLLPFSILIAGVVVWRHRSNMKRLIPWKRTTLRSKMKIGKIAILGTGGWGTALAVLWASRGNEIILWGHTPERVEGDRAESTKPGLSAEYNSSP